MTALGRRLSKMGVTVLCCQLSGHCGTEADLAQTTWRDWYESAEAALSQLEEHCDVVVAGGLSMGAILAARLAREQPERIRGLIMLAPTLWYDGWSMPWYRFLLKALVYTRWGQRYRFVEHEPYGLKDPRLRARVLHAMTNESSSNAGLLGTPSQAIREMWRLVKDVKSSLSQIRQDTLLIQAREDDVASLSNMFYLQRHLGGPVQSMVLDDSYHLITIDRQRSQVNQRVCDFVKDIRGERPLIAQRIDIRLQHAR
jgi:carboxylesterase